ncbi:MAG: AAA family ATPase [Desulfobacteraceae bacterium]|nr:AAA family ATPase [Desulfobacteraceae bacterium]
MPNKNKAWDIPFNPMRIKEVINDCRISQVELAEELGCSKTTICLAINRGYIPSKISGFREALERSISARPQVAAWMQKRGITMNDLFAPLGRDMRQAKAQKRKSTPAITTGDPNIITINWEVEMISQEALKHFKCFRNPFIDDIQKDADIYMSDEHRYIEAAMLDAARHGGFLAVVGEVGSGKSVMRRKVVETLKRDGDTLVIYPQMIDKTRLTAAAICDAIIQDISSEKCRSKLEDKTRQVQRLLMDRAKSGYRAVLIIEEAHDLNVRTLKYLKRFYELEDGYRKLLGIVLIGQSELKHMFNEGQNVDMREVIRRVQVAEIRGLNGNLKEYLAVKFKRVGKPVGEVFTEDAFDALSQRLTSTSRDGKGRVSHAYPLLVNNYVARAMNMAHEMGEPLISADVVMAL